MAQAQKINGQYEEAKANLLEAIKLAPGDKFLRDEYKQLMDLKDAKHKEWYSKMNGFFNSEKLQKIEDQDDEEQLIKEKLYKKEFAADWE